MELQIASKHLGKCIIFGVFQPLIQLFRCPSMRSQVCFHSVKFFTLERTSWKLQEKFLLLLWKGVILQVFMGPFMTYACWWPNEDKEDMSSDWCPNVLFFACGVLWLPFGDEMTAVTFWWVFFSRTDQQAIRRLQFKLVKFNSCPFCDTLSCPLLFSCTDFGENSLVVHVHVS